MYNYSSRLSILLSIKIRVNLKLLSVSFILDPPISNSINLEEMDVQQTREPEPPVNNTESTVEQREVSNSEEPMDTAEEEEGKEKEGKEEKQKEVEEEEENKDTENKEKEEEEEDEAVVESNGDLFTLSIVNSYGSQEVKKLEDGDNLLKLTSMCLAKCRLYRTCNLLNFHQLKFLLRFYQTHCQTTAVYKQFLYE